MKRLLIVDDEIGSRESLRAIFSKDYAVTTANDADAGLEKLAEQTFDLVLLDFMMPGKDGVAMLKEAQVLYPDLPFLMVSASTSVRPVVDAIKAGALDYIAKPYDVEEIRCIVRRTLEASSLRRRVAALQSEVARLHPAGGAIGKSAAFKRIADAAARAAETDATVLITGESGTGKELIARMVHNFGARRDEPFVAVHCGALPEQLMESELFGHEKGAFTNADKRKPGRFDLAGSGTLFFDEVSEMSPATQVKLLRVLQEREYMRVGGTQVIRTNARIVAACNKDLKREVAEKRFREDLYYRLNVLPIHVPPLRERREDIEPLAGYFLAQLGATMNAKAQCFAPDAMDALTRYDWPGNVRELRNIVERVLVLHGREETLPLACLPDEFREGLPTQSASTPSPAPVPDLAGRSLEDAVSDFERQLVLDALARANGVQTKAAELLGTTRRILKYRMDKLGLGDGEEG